MHRKLSRIGSALLLTIAVVAISPRVVEAAGSKRVATSCCEMRAPSYLRFNSQGVATSNGVEVAVYSMPSSSSIETTFEVLDSMGGGSVTYETATGIWAVRSGFLSGTDTIYYIRAQYDKGCGEAGVLRISYPKSKKPQFSSAVATMSKSFRADLCG
jgi:hypothetical protein